jgi:hypothetical protein
MDLKKNESRSFATILGQVRNQNFNDHVFLKNVKELGSVEKTLGANLRKI